MGDLVWINSPKLFSAYGKIGLFLGTECDTPRYFKVLIDSQVIDVHINWLEKIAS